MSTADLNVDTLIDSLDSDQLEQLIERASSARAEKVVVKLAPLREEFNELMGKITKEVEKYGLTASKFLELRPEALQRHVVKYMTNEARASHAVTDTGRPRQTVPPKYRHPTDHALTWTGRGNKPRWVVELLDQGSSLDSLLIEKPQA